MLALVALVALASRSSSSAKGTRGPWQTNSFGGVEVGGKLPLLSTADARSFEATVRPWQAIAHDASAETGVPVPWILGVIFAESRGNPRARSSAGAIGLMQLLSPEARGGLSETELLDPVANIHAGARFLQRLRRSVDQLPEVASKYNAGAELDGSPHRSSSSPWGLREQPEYIDRVVAANNYAAGLGAS